MQSLRAAGAVAKTSLRHLVTLLPAAALAACDHFDPLPSPADPPLARIEAYSPFDDPLNASLTLAGSRIARELGPGAKCLGFRLLSLPTTTASSIGSYYAQTLQPDWQPMVLTPPPGMRLTAFRRGDAYFAAAVSDEAQNGSVGLVIVTTIVWNDDSSARRRRCLG